MLFALPEDTFLAEEVQNAVQQASVDVIDGGENTGDNDNGQNVGDVEYDPEEILALQLLTGKNASENQCGSHGEHSNHDNQQQHVLHGTDKVRILHQHLEILHTDKDFVGVEGAPLIQRQTEYIEGRHCHENDEQNHSRCHAREDKARALEIAFHLEPTP